jgi:hypothetical protein
MKIDTQSIVQGLIVGLLMAIFAAAISTYVEVKLLRADVDRLEVYVDQLWKQK